MTEQLIKKRYASLAALFSLISPGMGHLYAGKWQQAVLMPFVLLLFPGLFGWSGLIFLPTGMFVLLLVMVVFYLIVIVSAYLHARNSSSHQLNRSQRWYYYILFLVVVGVFHSVLFEYRGKLFAYETFHIPAASMSPTILIGDFMIVDTYAYQNKQAEPGDVVVFDYPKDRSVKYVKRVIGKGGDHVAYYNKVLYINGKPVGRKLVEIYTSPDSNEQMQIYLESVEDKQYSIGHMPNRPGLDAEYIIPEGHYFVMGDNRDNSNDSRYWGVFPNEYLIGKGMYIWFSADNDMNVRSERIGLKL